MADYIKRTRRIVSESIPIEEKAKKWIHEVYIPEQFEEKRKRHDSNGPKLKALAELEERWHKYYDEDYEGSIVDMLFHWCKVNRIKAVRICENPTCNNEVLGRKDKEYCSKECWNAVQ